MPNWCAPLKRNLGAHAFMQTIEDSSWRTSGLHRAQNSFRTFDAISTPICMPSLVAELVAFRLSW